MNMALVYKFILKIFHFGLRKIKDVITYYKRGMIAQSTATKDGEVGVSWKSKG